MFAIHRSTSHEPKPHAAIPKTGPDDAWLRAFPSRDAKRRVRVCRLRRAWTSWTGLEKGMA